MEDEATKRAIAEKMIEEQNSEAELSAAMEKLAQIVKDKGMVYIGIICADEGLRLMEAWPAWSAIQVSKGAHVSIPMGMRVSTDAVKTINQSTGILKVLDMIGNDISRATKVTIDKYKVKMSRTIGPEGESNIQQVDVPKPEGRKNKKEYQH